MTSNILHISFIRAAILNFWNVIYIPSISIALCSPNVSRNSRETALLDLRRFQSYGDESNPVGNLPPPMSNTRVNIPCVKDSINRSL